MSNHVNPRAKSAASNGVHRSAVLVLVASISLVSTDARIAAIRPLDGWPVTTIGGSTFSPVITRTPDGTSILLHSRAMPLPDDPLMPGPWLVARDSHGQVLNGWPVQMLGWFPFRPPAILHDSQGAGIGIFTYSGFVNGFAFDGSSLNGWPQPESDPIKNRAGPSLGDFDGDGVMEVLTADDIGHVYLWRSAGALMPGWPVTLPKPISGTGPSLLSTPAASDLDGDGIPEYVVAMQNGVVVVYDRFGRLKPGWPRFLSPRSSDRTPRAFAIVPLGDGTQGIAIGTTELGNDRLLFFRHDGEYVDGWPQFLGDFRVEPVSAGDLDGDGDPELVAGDTKDVWAFHLDGTVVDGWPQPVPAVGNHSQPLIADVTEDGRPDVLVFALGLSMWHLYAWEADGTLIEGFPFRPSSSTALNAWQGATLGDLNDDGLLDFAMASVGGGGDFRRPGRVHVFTFNTLVDESTMHWPTQGHDYQRTSTWTPPTRLFGGDGTVVPPPTQLGMSSGDWAMMLDVPEEAPVHDGLEVTALAGFTIPPVRVQLLEKHHPIGGGQVRIRGQVDGDLIIHHLEVLRAEHPEIMCTDNEISTWLDTEMEAPPCNWMGRVSSNQSANRGQPFRQIWLTVESPRVGIDKLQAHVQVQVLPSNR